MSLIGDALRKTRQEAADRDSDRKGVLFSAKIADGPSRSGLGIGLVLGALIAVFATVGGGLAVWWMLSGGQPQGPPQASAAANGTTGPDIDRRVGLAPPTDLPDSDDSDNSPEVFRRVGLAPPSAFPETRALEPPPETDALNTSAETAADSDTATDSVAVSATVSDADADTSPDPVPASDTEPATGFVGKEEGIDVYLMEADLGDVTLSLDYLVFRPTDPFAEINGTEVHIGGTVAGFRVKSVERDGIVLSDGRRTIVLRAP